VETGFRKRSCSDKELRDPEKWEPVFGKDHAQPTDNQGRGSVVNVQEKSSGLPTGADRPRLKIAIGSYGHTKAIKDGSIPIEGVDADMIEVTPHPGVPPHGA